MNLFKGLEHPLITLSSQTLIKLSSTLSKIWGFLMSITRRRRLSVANTMNQAGVFQCKRRRDTARRQGKSARETGGMSWNPRDAEEGSDSVKVGEDDGGFERENSSSQFGGAPFLLLTTATLLLLCSCCYQLPSLHFSRSSF